MCVCVREREGEKVRKREGESVCEDLMVKEVTNIVILNS